MIMNDCNISLGIWKEMVVTCFTVGYCHIIYFVKLKKSAIYLRIYNLRTTEFLVHQDEVLDYYSVTTKRGWILIPWPTNLFCATREHFCNIYMILYDEKVVSA
jgi:hypothetical protein